MEREAQTKDEKASLKEGLEREEKLVERGNRGTSVGVEMQKMVR